MKKFLVILFVPLAFISCHEGSQKSTQRTFPENMEKVLNAHGGYQNWDKNKTLSFTIDSTDHFTVDVKDRREVISTPTYELGNDGIEVWSKTDTSFKSDPKFLKNLMFYFYAMPFVLADPGIIYTDLADRNILGENYKAIKVSFQDSVGLSPKDEYYLYADMETGQMAWLAYTVTYFSGEKSDKMGWIKYDQWQKVNNVLLPEVLIWHKSDENGPTEIRSQRLFSEVTLSPEEKAADFYEAPEGAVIAE